MKLSLILMALFTLTPSFAQPPLVLDEAMESPSFEEALRGTKPFPSHERALLKRGFKKSHQPLAIQWQGSRFRASLWYVRSDSWESVQVVVTGTLKSSLVIDEIRINTQNP